MKKFFALLDKNKKYFMFTALVGITFSAISVSVPTLSGNLISSVVSNSSAWKTASILFIIVSLFRIAFAELNEFASTNLKIRQKSLMRQKAYRAFFTKGKAQRADISSFVSFVNHDIPNIAEQYFSGTFDILNCVCIILFSAFSLFFIHWAIALLIVGISVLIVFLPNTLRKKGGAARKEYSSVLGKYNTTLQSMLDGFRVIRSYLCESHTTAIVDAADEQIKKSERILLKHQLIVQAITTSLQVFKTALILLWGVYMVANRQIEIGGLIAAMQLSEMISAPIEVLAYLRHSRNEVLPLLKQYRDMVDYKPDSSENRSTWNEPLQTLQIKDLSYAVNGLSILTDVSMIFEQGKKYLITGESGSGKSTLLRLIAQIDNAQYNGEILYNGHNILNMSFESYYKQVCPVFQEPYLFYATLEENICLGRPINRNTYSDMINKLNLGYLLERYKDQEITPAIVENLSGGERQRIALARALVGQPSIYLLDEVTSSLDQRNAESIERLLLHESATIIHICHKCSSNLLPLYDTQYTLNKGKLSLS